MSDQDQSVGEAIIDSAVDLALFAAGTGAAAVAGPYIAAGVQAVGLGAITFCGAYAAGDWVVDPFRSDDNAEG
jgi:hypothetical protein